MGGVGRVRKSQSDVQLVSRWGDMWDQSPVTRPCPFKVSCLPPTLCLAKHLHTWPQCTQRQGAESSCLQYYWTELSPLRVLVFPEL